VGVEDGGESDAGEMGASEGDGGIGEEGGVFETKDCSGEGSFINVGRGGREICVEEAEV